MSYKHVWAEVRKGHGCQVRRTVGMNSTEKIQWMCFGVGSAVASKPAMGVQRPPKDVVA